MSTGESIAAAALFTFSDIDDRAATLYTFWDGTSGSNTGQFFKNGSALPAHHGNYLSPAELSQTTFVAGSASNTLYVTAFDGFLWAQYDQFAIV